VVGYVFYRIFNFLFGIFMQFFTLRLSMDLGLGIKRKVFTAILESDWMSLTQYHSGDLVNRILSDSSTISSFVLDQVPAVIVQCIQFIAAFSLLTYYDWSLTIVALVGIPLYLFVIKLKGKRLRDYNMRAQEITSKNMSFLSESMTNIMVIKSFTLVPEFIRRYRKVHDEMYDWTMEKTRYGIVTGVITGTLSKMLGYVITAFILYRVITGSLSIGMLAAFGILMGQVSGPVSS
ncbi:MAG: ABC transporter ATP-binding protein, partial [Clostridia bacterium]